MNKLTKALTGTAAAAAMAVSTAAPAQARDNDGIGAGEIIAGAVILGGLAAILTSSRNNDRYDRYDRRGYSRISSRDAVQRCVNAAERQAARFYGPANVTRIDDIDRTRYGYKIEGNIVVDEGRHNSRWNRGRNYRGNYDRGEFTCYLDGRGAPRIDFDDLSRDRRW